MDAPFSPVIAIRRANVAPAGRPAPLVLLPGTLCDSRVFAALLAHLAPTLAARVVRIPALTTADDAAKLAAQLLIDLPPRFALLGFSLGGIVAIQMALLAPERVVGLALLNVNPGAAPSDGVASRRAAPAQARAEGWQAHVDRVLWPSYAPVGIRDPNLREQVVAMAEAVGFDGYARQIEVALTRSDNRSRLAGLRVPVLALTGALDRLCPPEMSQEIASRVSGATLAILPEAGHLALMQTPEAVAAPVRDWLARVDASTQAGSRSGADPIRTRQDSP